MRGEACPAVPAAAAAENELRKSTEQYIQYMKQKRRKQRSNRWGAIAIPWDGGDEELGAKKSGGDDGWAPVTA